MPTDDTDSPTVVVPRSVREEILAHARDGAPEEVCGILAGTWDEGDHRVEARHPAENVAETPRTRYEIGPREQLALMEEIEDAGREVVGFYHSHPRGPARPSATDAAQATWPGRRTSSSRWEKTRGCPSGRGAGPARSSSRSRCAWKVRSRRTSVSSPAPR
nr:desampylase [Halorussus sp. MSC15.2]